MLETEKKKRYEWSCHVMLAFDANKKDEKMCSFPNWILACPLQMSLLGQAMCTMGDILTSVDQKLLLTLT